MADFDDFDFTCLPEEARDQNIKKEDFVLQQADKTIHEQRFQTKPTTFFKDSMKRFSKNKSSVVAAYILGALILLSIFVPIFNTNDVTKASNPAFYDLEPKLFDGGGFWDGTVKVKHKEIDPNTGLPDPTVFKPSGVKEIVYEGKQLTNTPNIYGKGGYVETGFYGDMGIEYAYLNTRSSQDLAGDFVFSLDLSASNLTVTNFVAADEEMLANDPELAGKGVVPENFEIGRTGLDFVYFDGDDEKVVNLISTVHKLNIQEGGDPAVPLNQIIETATGQTFFNDFYFRIVTTKNESSSASAHICSLVKSLVITTDSTKKKEQMYFASEPDEETLICGISFTDAMQMMVRTINVGTGRNQYKNTGYWNISPGGYGIAGSDNKYVKGIYLASSYFASFTYDSYTATLGVVTIALNNDNLEYYYNMGWIDYNIDVDIDPDTNEPYIDENTFYFDIINKAKCPMLHEIEDPNEEIEITAFVAGEPILKIETEVLYYKYLGYDQMPKFLFGTDSNGRDMFKYVFEGLRNSLLLGVITFAVCFAFGLLWGAISGYFGGAVDLVMERVTDILSGVPWIVVMTLVILKAGSTFGTFVLALCLTGWIGTASTTRTQFYRFRGREYVLASRTLGASDARLIAKHILPNALGTIITGAVLMIPSVIFSEATISYLGLGFRNLSSLGVILSKNQSQLTNHPYQLIFPSVVIALVMISFNLFGNGLRDAINPSLKGEDE